MTNHRWCRRCDSCGPCRLILHTCFVTLDSTFLNIFTTTEISTTKHQHLTIMLRGGVTRLARRSATHALSLWSPLCFRRSQPLLRSISANVQPIRGTLNLGVAIGISSVAAWYVSRLFTAAATPETSPLPQPKQMSCHSPASATPQKSPLPQPKRVFCHGPVMICHFRMQYDYSLEEATHVLESLISKYRDSYEDKDMVSVSSRGGYIPPLVHTVSSFHVAK